MNDGSKEARRVLLREIEALAGASKHWAGVADKQDEIASNHRKKSEELRGMAAQVMASYLLLGGDAAEAEKALNAS